MAHEYNEWYVDVPKQPNLDPGMDNEWENVQTFATREEAIAFAKEQFGADDEGRVSLVTS